MFSLVFNHKSPSSPLVSALDWPSPQENECTHSISRLESPWNEEKSKTYKNNEKLNFLLKDRKELQKSNSNFHVRFDRSYGYLNRIKYILGMNMTSPTAITTHYNTLKENKYE